MTLLVLVALLGGMGASIAIGLSLTSKYEPSIGRSVLTGAPVGLLVGVVVIVVVERLLFGERAAPALLVLAPLSGAVVTWGMSRLPMYQTRPPARPESPAHEALAYGQPTGFANAAMSTNGFATASFVLGLLGVSLLGLVFGLVALNQIKQTQGRQGGKGLATAGVILSALWMALSIAVLVVIYSAQPDY